MCTTFKCKVNQSYKVSKVGGPSIIEEDTWLQMRSLQFRESGAQRKLFSKVMKWEIVIWSEPSDRGLIWTVDRRRTHGERSKFR
jgi:hypothetical protein